jgi:transcriptional regulator with XRE-family HTH domain
MMQTRSKREVKLDRHAIGERIAQARQARRWKQADLADAIGVAPSTLGAWEAGWRVPSAGMVLRLAVHLRRTTDWLLTGATSRRGMERMFDAEGN